MSDGLVINQRQGLGNDGTQIGVQNNFGLTVTDAVNMSFEIFKQYYPKLRDELLAELNILVSDKLSCIPQENIVYPKARIVVPTLQYASITEEEDVRELYANLLANSMNEVVKDGVHPGFVEIIKQLSPDEAKMLRYIYKNTYVPTLGLKVHKKNGRYLSFFESFTNITEYCGCEDVGEYDNYIDNLIRLGLIIKPNDKYLISEEKYEPLKNHSFIVEQREKFEKMDTVSKVEFVKGLLELTSFGKKFCGICLQTQNIIDVELDESRDNNDQL